VPGYNPAALGIDDKPLGRPSDFLDAIAGGAAKAAYEAKDMVFGATPPAQQSSIRQAVEAGTDQAENASAFNQVAGTISQFAVGMLGVGKIAAATKLATLGEAAIGVRATETVKAATAGAAVFDPNQDRLSNLIQSSPYLANPLTGFLSAKPDDPAWEGRLKTAMESIGLDATLGTVFMAASKLYKAVASGDHAAVPAATEDLQAAQEAAAAKPTAAVPEVVPAAATEGGPSAEHSAQPAVSFEEAPGQQQAPEGAARSPATEAPGAQEAPQGQQTAGEASGAPEASVAAPEAPLSANENEPGVGAAEPNAGGPAPEAPPTAEAVKAKPGITITPEQAESFIASTLVPRPWATSLPRRWKRDAEIAGEVRC
jgi:hypothetical protein